MAEASAATMLEIDELTVRYGRAVQVLHGINLKLGHGEALAILGSNGAGKSTLVRAISGTIGLHRGLIVSGSIRVEGASIVRLNPSKIVRNGVVQVPENRRIFKSMSVLENLKAGSVTVARKQHDGKLQQVMEIFPILEERMKQRAGLLSGGEQQMLAIARALMADPKVLILDEPSLGLAPRIVTQVGQIVQRINGAGVSVILVEQNATMALSVATRAMVLEMGRIVDEGPSQKFLEAEDLADQYLGGGELGARLAKLREDGTAGLSKTLGRWSA